jgi:HlyD family secretion protein
MPDSFRNGWPWLLLIAVVGGGGLAAWQAFAPSGQPDGIASANGRIEATEIDIAAKTAGRVEEINVGEGDFVQAGEEIARMDTAVLKAQRREAEAELERTRIAVETATSLVTQRQAEAEAARALVAQRKAELDAAEKQLKRSRELVGKNAISEAQFDNDRAAAEAAKAAVAAARAQVAAAEAAIGQARSNVVASRAAVESAHATIERIQADIDDSILVAPRDGRVQYRVAQPGEVLSPGGVVLNMVDLSDVYMTFFLPTEQAGRVALGAEVHLVLDAVPQYVIPAKVTFVADVAQFTPKTVETAEERQKLMFRIKAQIDPELLQKYLRQVKTGLPGMAYVRLDPQTEWPPELQVRLPQ